MARPDRVVDLSEKLSLIGEHWSPKVVGQINDLHIKVAKVQGEFVWHSHDDTDEFFLVHSGELTIHLQGGREVTLGPGEFFVVPRGVDHRPVAQEECEIVLLEPAGVVNTGDAEAGDLTADEEWI